MLAQSFKLSEEMEINYKYTYEVCPIAWTDVSSNTEFLHIPSFPRTNA
jgi:hypothetical protein